MVEIAGWQRNIMVTLRGHYGVYACEPSRRYTLSLILIRLLSYRHGTDNADALAWIWKAWINSILNIEISLHEVPDKLVFDTRVLLTEGTDFDDRDFGLLSAEFVWPWTNFCLRADPKRLNNRIDANARVCKTQSSRRFHVKGPDP